MPVERQIRGLHGARVVERDPAATAAMLTQVLGFVPHATEGDWQRFVIPDPALGDHPSSSGGLLSGVSGRHLDVRTAAADARRGAWGTGSIHHLAWRVDDDAHEAEMRSARRQRRRAPDAGDRSLLVQVGLLQGARRRALRAGDRRPRLRGRRIGAHAGRIAGAAAVARSRSAGRSRRSCRRWRIRRRCRRPGRSTPDAGPPRDARRTWRCSSAALALGVSTSATIARAQTPATPKPATARHPHLPDQPRNPDDRHRQGPVRRQAHAAGHRHRSRGGRPHVPRQDVPRRPRGAPASARCSRCAPR